MKVEQFELTKNGHWSPALPLGVPQPGVQLALLFGDVDLARAPECSSLIRQAFPQAHIFGCTTAGEIFGTQVRNGTLVLTAVTFEHTQVAVSRARIESLDDSLAAGQTVIRQLPQAGLRHVFVVSEGLRVYGGDVVKGISSALPSGVTASGGFAADRALFQATHVWCDSEPESSTVVALGLYGERLRIGLSVTGGWRPFGPDRVITKSQRNVVYEFDGRPALALYKQYLGEHAAGLPASGHLFPLELCHPERKTRVLRALLAVDEKEQSITYASDVPQGSYARFMMGQIEDLVSGAQKAAKANLADLGRADPCLSLVVSCAGRREILSQRTEEELEAIQDVFGAKTAMTGFYSYGEIGRPEGACLPELHNETISITSLIEE
jgi:hypothetical protein